MENQIESLEVLEKRAKKVKPTEKKISKEKFFPGFEEEKDFIVPNVTPTT